jgi:hypothetical protein
MSQMFGTTNGTQRRADPAGHDEIDGDEVIEKAWENQMRIPR